MSTVDDPLRGVKRTLGLPVGDGPIDRCDRCGVSWYRDSPPKHMMKCPERVVSASSVSSTESSD